MKDSSVEVGISLQPDTLVYMNDKGTPIPTTQALRQLATGKWTVTYPNGRMVQREGATLRSFGLVWGDGCELRKQGVKFFVPANKLDGALAGYHDIFGELELFASYTPRLG